MTKKTVYNKFNRGEIDDLALARDDVQKINASAALIENFLPLRLGPMQYRPGFGFLDNSSQASYFMPFTRHIDDQALLEFGGDNLKVWVNDEIISRPAVSSFVVNGDPFVPGLIGWTKSASGAIEFSGDAEIYVQTTGDPGHIYQSLTISAPDQGTEHGITLLIRNGPVKLQIGSAGVLGSEDLFSGVLLPGYHSLSATPATASLDITISADNEYSSSIEFVAIAASGEMVIPQPIADANLLSLRMSQVNDVSYIAFDSGAQFQVERRGIRSWSVVDFRSDDGPFELINTSTITLAASDLSGGVSGSIPSLTSSIDYFTPGHVGSLFKLASSGQLVEELFTAISQVSDSILVTGSGSSRRFAVTRTVTGSYGTTVITLQSSFDNASWSNVKDYTSNGTDNFNDGLDNQEVYYRLEATAFDGGSTTSVDTTMTFASGSIEGICRILSVISATLAGIQILKPFGSTDATVNWFQGSWSEDLVFPSAVSAFEGRLWFAGSGNIWGSVSDGYSSFDRDVVGDSASIFRTLAFASSSDVHWLSESIRLIAGITTDEVSIRSSSFNVVLTPSNVNLKRGTGQGAAPLDCMPVDSSLYYIQRSLRKIMKMSYASGSDGYTSQDLMVLNETICRGSDSLGIKRIAIVRQPETRVFVVLNDGTARVYLTDPAEEVAAWSRISTDGIINDIVTLPGLSEDDVYFTVTRTNGTYLEKMAHIEDAKGGPISFHHDSYVFDAGPTTTVSVSHIANGEIVKAWSGSQSLGEFTVSAGAITIPSSSNVTVGLPYNADYTSNKLGGFSPYSVLNSRVRVEALGMIARDIVLGDMQVGPSFSSLSDLPLIENGTTISHTVTQTEYDYTPFEFDGSYETDSRVYFRCTGPATIMALTYEVKESRDKSRKAE